MQQALRFLAAVRKAPALVAGCADGDDLVARARAAGYAVTWPEIQEAFRLDWTMRAVRFGLLQPGGATREQVREYFDRSTPSIVRDVGTTYQAGILPHGSYRDSNLYFAARAGIADGERVLDAGCGAGGPAVDLAEAFPNLRVEGITISPVQARAAEALVRERGLQDRVRVHVGDYHDCPFPDGSFDAVLFLETAGYTDRPDELWREVHRLLRPGGRVYMKEPFLARPPRPGVEQEQFRAVLEVYRYRMRTLEEVVAGLQAAGFEEVRAEALDLDTRRFFVEAMDGTEFGDQHRRALDRVPAVYGDVRAVAGQPPSTTRATKPR